MMKDCNRVLTDFYLRCSLAYLSVRKLKRYIFVVVNFKLSYLAIICLVLKINKNVFQRSIIKN